MDQPRWLAFAWRELGQREVRGPADNPRIAALLRDAGHAGKRDEVPWCAAFVGACLERAGERGTRSLLARSYLGWGAPLEEGRLGAVAVLSRGRDPATGHVGFLLGEAEASVYLLGGNQSDAVTVAAFPKARVLGYRWPSALQDATQREADEGVFEAALAHVLEMEGGYTDDPHDPGGPTNFGITLKVYAAWKGAALDAGSRERLKAELKRIPEASVRAIYRARYWGPAGCGELAPALALFHFDAAVNHGVAGAIRLLQEAAGTDADGEIGPLTRAAIARLPLDELLAAYADARRARYRALPHFWRFGRGWLKRVDATLARALALAGAPPLQPSPSQQEGASDMPAASRPATKWWGQSVTIWGAIITALSTVLPALGPMLGVDIEGELVRQAGEHIVALVQAVGGLIGIALTIYGRVRAAGPLARRDLTVKL